MSELNIPMAVNKNSKEMIPTTTAYWLNKLEISTFAELDFVKYWKACVVDKILNEKGVDSSFDISNRKGNRFIVCQIEELICDSMNVKLMEIPKSQICTLSKCCRVFNAGDPTYRCLECEVNSTCVLCVDCFKLSSHKDHMYKMGTSYGNGICDCGDLEAWKQDAQCEIHKLGIKDRNTFINKEMVDRANISFKFILHYAHVFLTSSSYFAPNVSDSDVLKANYLKKTFCVVFYHSIKPTFDQILLTFDTALNIKQKEAIKYITTIQREGRVIVYRGTRSECMQINEVIRECSTRKGGPLVKSRVHHYYNFVNQMLALKLLEWMENVMKYIEFKEVFSIILLEDSTIDGILKKYPVMWKSARQQWYKLIINGVFNDFDSKLKFAVAFSRNIDTIVNDFIDNYHEYSNSVFSLSVHLFTVPKIAKHLIIDHNILHKLLTIFSKYCHQNLDENGKLTFPGHLSHSKFNSSLIILQNITHLLDCVPDTWTDSLRKPFLQAVFLFIKILNCMQDMNLIIRQIEEHVTFQPEWETTFNLVIKLKPLITKILLWCGSDSCILKKVYTAVLKEISENCINFVKEPRTFIDLEVNCVDYEVLSKPVSIHIPLYRFLAGLHLYLDRYNHRELQYCEWKSPELIIEPVLRVLVLKSQVRAEIWIRNGTSLVNQMYLYNNSKCRLIMSDKDIIILQIGATLIDSNEFVVHVLNKFDLLNWELECYDISEDESSSKMIILREEFLSLIITIVGERYNTFVGNVTLEDCIQQNVIQQLSTGPKSHSELYNSLSHIEGLHTFLDKSINEVAESKKVNEKTVFTLKPIYYDNYNVYFYHSLKAEELDLENEQIAQRQKIGKSDYCPPPRLPSFSDAFANVINIMQCDVMLHIMKLTLNNSMFPCSSYSDCQFRRVLHLIGYALHEEQNQQNTCFTFTERSEGYNIEATLHELVYNNHFNVYQDLVIWTLNKFRQVSALKMKTKKSNHMQIISKEVEAVKRNIDINKLIKQKKVKLATKRKSDILTNINDMQTLFIQNNTALYEENFTNPEVLPDASSDPSITFDKEYNCILCQEQHSVTCTSKDMVLAAFIQKSSVLCQVREELKHEIKISDLYYMSINLNASPHISTCGHAMHLECYQNHFKIIAVQEANMQLRFKHMISFDAKAKEYFCPYCTGLCNTVIPLLPPVSNHTEPKNTEIVENIIFEKWIAGLNLLLKKGRTANSKPVKNIITVHPSSTVQPVTKASNSGQPITRKIPLQPANTINVAQLVFTQADDTFVNHLVPCEQFSIKNNNIVVKILLYQESSALEELVPVYKQNMISPGSDDIILQFAHSVFSNVMSFTENTSIAYQSPLLVWKACAYTIHSNEMIFRYKNEPLFGDLSCQKNQCMESLVRTSMYLGLVWKNKCEINMLALQFLSIVIDNGGNTPTGILDYDTFGMLVSLSMALPSLYVNHESKGSSPRGNTLDGHIFFLMFAAHVVQIILTLDIKDNHKIFEKCQDKDTLYIIRLFHGLRGIVIKNTVEVWNLIKNCCIPFLRCCSLFYHFLTGVPPPSVLTELNGDTYFNMCNYLGLPTTCFQLFDKTLTKTLIRNWSKHEKSLKIHKGSLKIFKDWMRINELVPLPDDYCHLLNDASTFICPNTKNEEVQNPAMCLVCGEMLCSQSYCCQTEFQTILVSDKLISIYNQN